MPPVKTNAELILYRLNEQDKKLDEHKRSLEKLQTEQKDQLEKLQAQQAQQLTTLQTELREISADIQQFKTTAGVMGTIGGFLVSLIAFVVDKFWKG